MARRDSAQKRQVLPQLRVARVFIDDVLQAKILMRITADARLRTPANRVLMRRRLPRGR